ncbi:uncharacterized protein LOC134855968 [Symsagittifera roscoffensis]|uniref:uncharacterized protein LOC134855968 n=1 Tax=Symsagittifera roscoffensis TaxID=84072 RepID=UPI00307B9E56
MFETMRRSKNAAKTIFLVVILFYVLFYLNLCLYNSFDSSRMKETVTFSKIFTPESPKFGAFGVSNAGDIYTSNLQSGSNISKSVLESQKFDADRRTFSQYDPVDPNRLSENAINVSRLQLDALAYSRCIEEFKYFYRVQILHNVIIDPNEGQISKENRGEFFSFTEKFMTMLCIHHLPHRLVHQTKYFKAMSVVSTEFAKKLSKTKNHAYEWMIAAVREEYANAYWMVMDVFDLFHIIRAIDKSVQVILLDNHPKSTMDQLWRIYFDDVLYLPSLKISNGVDPSKSLVFAENLIFRPNRQGSVFKNQMQTGSSSFSQFRNEGYQKVGVRLEARNCSRLRVTIVWRRNYVNHPGNPQGEIKRKITNEQEVMQAIRSFKNVEITEASLELMSVKEQIHLMSRTDVFFGVHGAGHTMAVYMPPGGMVVEITTPSKRSNGHMKQVAVNAGQSHILHVLSPSRKEASTDSSYYVRPDVVRSLMEKSVHQTCDYN